VQVRPGGWPSRHSTDPFGAPQPTATRPGRGVAGGEAPWGTHQG
jgi:hypothetical protein